MSRLKRTDRGAILMVKVTAEAKSSSLVAWEGEILKIRVQASPVKGRANMALVEYLQGLFLLRSSQIRIISGYRQKIKKIYLELEPEVAEKVIERQLLRTEA